MWRDDEKMTTRQKLYEYRAIVFYFLSLHSLFEKIFKSFYSKCILFYFSFKKQISTGALQHVIAKTDFQELILCRISRKFQQWDGANDFVSMHFNECNVKHDTPELSVVFAILVIVWTTTHKFNFYNSNFHLQYIFQ